MNLLRFARLSAWLTLFTASAALTAAFAEGTIRPASEGRIGFIAGSATNAETWDFKPSRWGRYDIEAAVSGAEKGAELVIEIAGQTFGFVLPVGADERRTTVVPVSRFYLPKSDPCKVKAGPKAGTAGGFTLHGISLVPAPEGGPVVQQASGEIVLRASEATTHSVMMRYEPATNKNCLGYWVTPSDWAHWDLTVTAPGTFDVEVWQGCGNGNGGSDVVVEVGGEKLAFVVEETGHFQNFVPRRIGRVKLASAGKQTLAIKPQRKQASAVMDIRKVRLVPVTLAEVPAPAARAFVAAKRVVFLGDSITYAGEWVEFVESWLRLKFPDADVELIDLGLPSETVSGLSEPGHAGGSFPRPGLHERLGRVLEKAKPDLIVACYGMNDGIYHPYGDDRAKAFQDGIRKLRERAGHEGVRVVHLTPPVFDAVPLGGHTLPAGLDAYPQPFEGYDGVLARYSAWLVEQRKSGWEVVDIHTPMARFLEERRKTDPKFLLAGDGVHANTQGHWLIAREVLRHLGADEAIVSSDTPEALVKSGPRAAEVLKLVQQRQRTQKDTWLTYVGHVRPGMGKGKTMDEAANVAAEVSAKLRALR